MRRSTLLTAVVVACIVAAVAFVVLRDDAGGAAQAEDTSPPHYFIPGNLQDRDVLLCDLTWEKERAPTDGRWAQPLQPCSFGEGWARSAPEGARAYGPRSELIFELEDGDRAHLIVTARSLPLEGDGSGRTMQVAINGQALGETDLPQKWTTLQFDIPPGRLAVGTNTLELFFSGSASEAPAGNSKRARPITAWVQAVALVRTLGSRRSSAQLRHLMSRAENYPAPPATVYEPESGRFNLEAGGSLVLPFRPVVGSRTLVVEAAASDGLDVSDSELTLRIEDLATGAVRTESLYIAETRSILDREKARREIPIEDFAGDPCLLVFVADPQPAGAAIEIAPPRVVAGPPEPDRQREIPQTDVGPPDIVWITLDAARADHFSCYGYPRPTTPNIDRLAAESLVFTKAFALAPYTLCSVQTMITGLSFFDHGVVSHDNILRAEAITLAERLKSVGYHTACFSCSPNNSVDKGSNQGYDEFFELWNEVPREESRVPTYLAGRLVDWLAENDDAAPLHLQLHFVPPHAPYTPAPEFDVFTDPSYDGPCDGNNETLAALDAGRLQPSEQDLQHVLDLYDGNLLAADSAVAQVLAALARRPRWDDTVVLVTADHGDAFLEHSRMGHNSTVYDEMLHVPFILRVPRGFETGAVDVERLATLADLAPTLLGTVPATMDHPTEGVDLLAANGAHAGRFFVARTTGGDSPYLGLRTERWKLILTDWGHGELYDLLEDPGEQHDLALVNRPVFVALAQMLTQRAAEPPLLDPSTRSSDISEADREMLEALGYTE